MTKLLLEKCMRELNLKGLLVSLGIGLVSSATAGEFSYTMDQKYKSDDIKKALVLSLKNSSFDCDVKAVKYEATNSEVKSDFINKVLKKKDTLIFVNQTYRQPLISGLRIVAKSDTNNSIMNFEIKTSDDARQVEEIDFTVREEKKSVVAREVNRGTLIDPDFRREYTRNDYSKMWIEAKCDIYNE